jgi:hypothetical protein
MEKMIPNAEQREIQVHIANTLKIAVEAQGYEVDDSEMLMHQAHTDTCQICNQQMGMVADQTHMLQDFVAQAAKIGIMADSSTEQLARVEWLKEALSSVDEDNDGVSDLFRFIKKRMKGADDERDS